MGVGLMMVQTCVGVLLQCLLTGVIFTKLSIPKSRANTILFSQSAVMCVHQRRFMLKFRVVDLRKSHLINISITALLVCKKDGAEIAVKRISLTFLSSLFFTKLILLFVFYFNVHMITILNFEESINQSIS